MTSEHTHGHASIAVCLHVCLVYTCDRIRMLRQNPLLTSVLSIPATEPAVLSIPATESAPDLRHSFLTAGLVLPAPPQGPRQPPLSSACAACLSRLLPLQPPPLLPHVPLPSSHSIWREKSRAPVPAPTLVCGVKQNRGKLRKSALHARQIHTRHSAYSTLLYPRHSPPPLSRLYTPLPSWHTLPSPPPPAPFP